MISVVWLRLSFSIIRSQFTTYRVKNRNDIIVLFSYIFFGQYAMRQFIIRVVLAFFLPANFLYTVRNVQNFTQRFNLAKPTAHTYGAQLVILFAQHSRWEAAHFHVCTIFLRTSSSFKFIFVFIFAVHMFVFLAQHSMKKIWKQVDCNLHTCVVIY